MSKNYDEHKKRMLNKYKQMKIKKNSEMKDVVIKLLNKIHDAGIDITEQTNKLSEINLESSTNKLKIQMIDILKTLKL